MTASDAPTARDAFRHMLNTVVSPRLRAAGFTGSGGRYELAHPTHWILVGFQKSQGSTADAVTFTVNLLVVGRRSYQLMRVQHPEYAERPSPGVHLGGEAWNERLGFLLPEARDTWWDVRSGDDASRVGAEVADAIVDVALPRMLAQARGDRGGERLRALALPLARLINRHRAD